MATNMILELTKQDKTELAEKFRRFDYAEWRRNGLPEMSVEMIAEQPNQLSQQIDNV